MDPATDSVVDRALRSFVISVVIASVCLMVGLCLVFVIEPPRPTMGWILVGLSFVLDTVAMWQFIVLARARQAKQRDAG